MSRRISSILFLVSIMILVSSCFYYYISFKNDTNDVPIKYDLIQKEQQEKYQAEEDRVQAINRTIYEDVLEKFNELGGDPSELSRFDSVRFMTGGTTNNELLNSIGHEELLYNSLPQPLNNRDKGNLSNKEINQLRDGFKLKLIIHGYVFLMILFIYFISLILFRSRTRRIESS